MNVTNKKMSFLKEFIVFQPRNSAVVARNSAIVARNSAVVARNSAVVAGKVVAESAARTSLPHVPGARMT